MRMSSVLALAAMATFAFRAAPVFAQSESEVGDDSKYYCESEYDEEFDELFGTLRKVSNDRAVRFAKALKSSNSALQTVKRKIKARTKAGLDSTDLKEDRDTLKLEIADIKTCRDEGDTGRSRGSSGNADPELACSVVGDPSSISTRIIGGEVCSIGSTGVVYILISTPAGAPDSSCTGTVVRAPGATAARHVIFAAHCAEGAGFIDINTPSGTMRATSFQKNPDWNGNQNTLEDGDVAIATFSTDIPTSSFTVLADDDFSLGETAVIGGYGLDENGNSSETRLKAGTVTLSAFSSYGLTIEYDGSSGSNTCNGDSGGPFFVERSGGWVLGGVTSNGIQQDCGPGDISNFANLRDPTVKAFINGIAPGLIP